MPPLRYLMFSYFEDDRFTFWFQAIPVQDQGGFDVVITEVKSFGVIKQYAGYG